MAIARQVANKVWITQVANGEFVRQEGFNPSYVEIRGNKVSRVNLMATVVSKFLSEDENYGTLTLDDGTETIRVKAFGPDVMKIRKVNVGSVVTLVGKLKHYQNETYISPEVAREVTDPNWLIVRKLELGEPVEVKKIEKKEVPKTETKPEEKTTSSKELVPKSKALREEEIQTIKISPEKEQASLNDKIIKLIKEKDNGEGADIDKIIDEMKMDRDECKNLIIGLLKTGDLFEPKKGMLKVLD